jgi:anti-anti-sigma regulatory factor
MLKISVVDGQRQCRIIVEGALIERWTDELVTACEKTRTDLQGRELMVDVRGLTTISSSGANLLLQLMRDKIKLQCGVYVRELLRQLARDARRQPQEVEDSLSNADSEPDRNAD